MKNKKKIIGTLAILLVIGLIGISYAFFNYKKEGSPSEVIAGSIYLNYSEGNEIDIPVVFPESYSEAMSREDNIFTFQIKGKNTSTKDLYYKINLDYGNTISGKTRIKDEDVKIYLERNGDKVIDGVSFEDFDNRTILVETIEAGTMEEQIINYELRIWVSEDVVISDTAPYAGYTTTVWKNSFASLRVNVEGQAGGTSFVKPLMSEIETKYADVLTDADAFGNRYISGTKAGITNNYLKFSDKLWRIVGINADGTIKLITESAMTYMPWDSTGNTDYATSEIHEWLNDEFLNTLDQEQIATGTVNYTGVSLGTLAIGEIKTLQARVGLLSVFDYIGVISADLATGNVGYMADNYLMNGEQWWTNALEISENGIYYQSQDGSVRYYYRSSSISGVRPVINLVSTIRIVDGDGSKENPYVIEGEEGKEDKYNYNSGLVTKLSNLTETDMNGTRYVTGLTEDNYIWYSGKLWRVVALNDDGSVKIVTQNNITSIVWDINNSNNYSTSQVRNWLNNEFLNTLYNKENIVKESQFDYGYGIVNDKLGLLTLDEYYRAGGSTDVTNTYLNNNYHWWLVTPYTVDNNSSGVWSVDIGGYADDGYNADNANGVRPSVNLISDIRISGGEGTATNPYRLEGDMKTATSSEYLNTRISGEYVRFNDTVYRIVGIETINNQKLTKITMADYSKNSNTIATNEAFGNSGVFSKTTGIGLYLNDWYGGLANKEMIATDSDGVLWYQGENTEDDYTKAKLGTGISATIGLPYYGEMFSTQFGPGYEDSVWTWFMTRWNNSISYVWDVDYDGGASRGGTGGAGGVRPSMYLKSSVRIKDTNGDGDVGNGTASYPYEIAID